MSSRRLLSHLIRTKPTTLTSTRRSTRVQPRSQPPHLTSTPTSSRFFTSTTCRLNVEPPEYLDANERKVFDMIKDNLSPTKLEVQDISGGCGSMYGIDIVSEKFKGLSTIKQHRLVNSILGEEIKKWHGVQLKTKAPE